MKLGGKVGYILMFPEGQKKAIENCSSFYDINAIFMVKG